MNIETVRRNFARGLWSRGQVELAVRKGVVTREEAEAIFEGASDPRARVIERLTERLERLKNTGSWAEIELGSEIGAGARVRYLFKTYECAQSHVKSLLRLPTNGAYWAEIED